MFRPLDRPALVAAALLAVAVALAGCSMTGRVPDALPSWRAGGSGDEIEAFVRRVADPDGEDHVPAERRVAVFDNDGTLWAEQPVYVQLLFAMDRARELAPEHPEWRTTEPFRSAIAGDVEGVMAGGGEAIDTLIGATHGGVTTDAFREAARAWLGSARHPDTGRLYTDMVYAPMLELMELLRDNGFEVYIVSGGGQDFLRVFAERVYGVPPENVIGSRMRVVYDDAGGEPTLRAAPEVAFLNDKGAKPVGIHERIGRRPLMAFGNSDGDYAMVRWTTAGPGPRLGALVHHTDARREWAYDRGSPVGRLERGLDEAAARGWVLIDMAQDWDRVFR